MTNIFYGDFGINIFFLEILYLIKWNHYFLLSFCFFFFLPDFDLGCYEEDFFIKKFEFIYYNLNNYLKD